MLLTKKELKIPPMKPETKTTIKIGDTVIDAEDLSQEERSAIIELAIHLAAPKLSELLAGVVSKKASENKVDEYSTSEHDKLLFELPPILSVQEVAEYLRVSKQKIYEMCRAYDGNLFPSFKIGNRFRIDRTEFIEWLKNGGMNNYEEKIAANRVKKAQKKRPI